MNRALWRISALAALILLALSCSEPLSSETFVKKTDGTYTFEVDMSRSGCTYDISFYTRLDSRHKVSGFPMDVRWKSPSGEVYDERVYFDCSEHSRVLYRTGLIPQEEGVWTVGVRADAEGMRGLGLICERKF